MKKSLADMKPADGKEAPKERSFGAFKAVEGNQATIDLEKLREHNIFFATPCYGGMLTDQYFLSMFRASQTLMRHGINFRVTTLTKRITSNSCKKYSYCNVFRIRLYTSAVY